MSILNPGGPTRANQPGVWYGGGVGAQPAAGDDMAPIAALYLYTNTPGTAVTPAGLAITTVWAPTPPGHVFPESARASSD